MNKKNFIKGTALPVALFFSMVTLAPVLGFQPASAAIDVVQQKGVIKGTVVDTQGEPVIGANVVAQGTSVGTITDIDGVFRLNVSPGTKLRISFIGYSDQTVTAKNDMRVVLAEDATALQEVEIVAYGVQKKITMTKLLPIHLTIQKVRPPQSSRKRSRYEPGDYYDRVSGA